MGEAKRRRAAGRLSPRVQDFRVSDGLIAVSVDMKGHNPMTGAIDVRDLDRVLEEAVLAVRGQPLVQTLLDVIRSQMPKVTLDNPGAAYAVSTAALTLCLRHPLYGQKTSRQVADAISKQNRAHLTLHISPRGLAIAMGPHFLDLEEALAATPDGVLAGSFPEGSTREFSS